MEERYDLCVIGAGTAGFAAAQAARAAGRSLVLVSGPGDLGGTCILRGCMPAKTLLASTERLGDVDSADGVAVQTSEVHVDVPALIARKRELVDYFSEDRVAELAHFPLLRGSARFVAQDAIDVGGRIVRAERFILATGSRIVPPPIPGLSEIRTLTSDDVLELDHIPPSIAVLGGGPVGCEFAQYFARLGARVTLLQDGPALLRNEDADVGAAIEQALRADGVEVVLDARIEHCAAAGGETLVRYTAAGVAAAVRVTRVMLASGREPNLAGLDLAAAGVIGSDGQLAVDPYLRTTNSRILAAGDVLGRRCLVHVAEYAGRLAAANAFAPVPARADFDRYEAHAVYTQPHVAVAGLTEAVCRERGLDVRIERYPFSDIGKAVVSGEAAGFVKLIAESASGRVAGVAIVGTQAIDLIGTAIALIDRGATVAEMADLPYLHPTLGEILGRVAENWLTAAPARQPAIAR